MNRKQFSKEKAKMKKYMKYMKYSLFTGVLFSGMMLFTACTKDADSVDKAELYRKTYWWDWKVWELKLYKLRITKYINRYGCRFFENV